MAKVVRDGEAIVLSNGYGGFVALQMAIRHPGIAKHGSVLNARDISYLADVGDELIGQIGWTLSARHFLNKIR